MGRTVSVPTGENAFSDAEFKAALRQVASSVAIVTARSGDLSDGLTATSVCLVSSAPPTMLLCLALAASTDALIQQSGAFAINFLSDQQHAIARLFSAGSLTPPERFAEGEWTSLQTGSPVLGGTVASFDCTVESCIRSGTHNVYLGRVVGATSLERDVLLYRNGLFRRLDPA